MKNIGLSFHGKCFVTPEMHQIRFQPGLTRLLADGQGLAALPKNLIPALGFWPRFFGPSGYKLRPFGRCILPTVFISPNALATQ